MVCSHISCAPCMATWEVSLWCCFLICTLDPLPHTLGLNCIDQREYSTNTSWQSVQSVYMILTIHIVCLLSVHS